MRPSTRRGVARAQIAFGLIAGAWAVFRVATHPVGDVLALAVLFLLMGGPAIGAGVLTLRDLRRQE